MTINWGSKDVLERLYIATLASLPHSVRIPSHPSFELLLPINRLHVLTCLS